MQSMNVRLDAFEGPLDLLYHLIEKNEIDLYDIPMAKLTEQYLEYLDHVPNQNMDGMSEFLLMAATLLEIKSKMLLPDKKSEEEEGLDPREELVAKLLEYKKFKGVTDHFKVREEEAALFLYKEVDSAVLRMKAEKEPEDLEEFLEGITLKDIYQAFSEVMRRKELKVDKVRSTFQFVERDTFTVHDKIGYIRDLLRLTPRLSFFSIFREDVRKIEVVVTFLALLELIKTKEIMISQKETFDEILITKSMGHTG